MRRSTRLSTSLVLTAVFLLGTAQAALAGAPIPDPAVLEPPPPAGAQCQANGPWIICQTAVSAYAENEPGFDLPCGTVYVTGADVRTGIRWYADGKLVKRHVFQHAEGSWSLSSTGAGPIVTFFTHANWAEVYTVPGDLTTAVGSQRGTDLLAKSADGGVVTHISGTTRGDPEQFHGLFRWIDDPAVAADVCEALGG